MKISLLLMVITSFLALPTPYYFLKDSTFRQDYSFSRDERNKKLELITTIVKRLIISIIIFAVVFGLNSLIFFLSHETESLKIYLLFWIIPILLNMFYLHDFWFTKHEGKIQIILICALVFTLLLPIHDLVFSYKSVEATQTVVKELHAPFLDFETLKIRFDISEFKKSYYDSETSNYIHFSDSHKKNQIIVVSSDNVTAITTKYLPDISLLRSQYPSESFKFYRVDYSDESNPVAIYLLLERKGLFSKPQIKKNVYVNLQNGKISDNIFNK